MIHGPTAEKRRRRRTAAWLAPVAALALLALLLPRQAGGQSENLLDRITNERMRAFEDRLTGNLNAAVARYISEKQFVLRVNVLWNRNVIPAVQAPGLGSDRQKLPGFPIFVKAPDSPAVEEGVPPFVRMVVKLLLDETLPEYYERFLRKIVPIVARFDEGRGDQVIVLKEAFPPVQQTERPPTLSEKALMQQLRGVAPQPLAAAPQQPGFAPAAPGGVPSAFGPPSRQLSPRQAAQIAYDEGRYADALRIVQSAFQRAPSNKDRGGWLGMEGSVYYTMQNFQAARDAWRRGLVFDPANTEIHNALNLLEGQMGKGTP